jgi:hypothetical protein
VRIKCETSHTSCFPSCYTPKDRHSAWPLAVMVGEGPPSTPLV